jgi:hypothetical protein
MAMRITAEMVAAFKAKDDEELRRLLHLKPWELSPLDVDNGLCDNPEGTAGAESWPKAVALCKKLKAA